MTTHHVLTILAVRDLEKSSKLYDQVFRWDKQVDVPVYIEYRLPDGNRLGLYNRESFSKNTGQLPISVPKGQIAPTELYLQCDDLEEVIERMNEAGAKQLSPISVRDWGDEASGIDSGGNDVRC